jgi:BirA family biotin operon repressor/biotin-[acetyl-CoA-carboxylase] ligase
LNPTFDKEAYRHQLNTQWLGHELCYFEQLNSTNSYLKKLSGDKIKQGMLCLADYQTKGRGQYERKWESEAGENLTFSLVFLPSHAERFHVLTLACATALVEQLNNLLKKSCSYIKWPNDVMLNGKKVAGFLTETVFTGNKFDRLVIGIGININQDSFSEELQRKATSVLLETGNKISRASFLVDYLGRVEHHYTLWHRQHAGLLKKINRNIEGYGQWVGLAVDGERRKQKYKLLGINETGQLLLLNKDGGIESFSYEQIRIINN